MRASQSLISPWCLVLSQYKPPQDTLQAACKSGHGKSWALLGLLAGYLIGRKPGRSSLIYCCLIVFPGTLRRPAINIASSSYLYCSSQKNRTLEACTPDPNIGPDNIRLCITRVWNNCQIEALSIVMSSKWPPFCVIISRRGEDRFDGILRAYYIIVTSFEAHRECSQPHNDGALTNSSSASLERATFFSPFPGVLLFFFLAIARKPRREPCRSACAKSLPASLGKPAQHAEHGKRGTFVIYDETRACKAPSAQPFKENVLPIITGKYYRIDQQAKLHLQLH